MSQEEHTGKTPAELATRAWQLAESIRTALLITRDGERVKARPMSATVRADEHVVCFLTSADSDTVQQLAATAECTLAFADTGGNKYVTFSGEATVGNDRARIRELWTAFAKAWWDSADDPDIRVITVRPVQAELWDSRGKLVAGAIMLSAAITGSKPAVGDHATIRRV